MCAHAQCCVYYINHVEFLLGLLLSSWQVATLQSSSVVAYCMVQEMTLLLLWLSTTTTSIYGLLLLWSCAKVVKSTMTTAQAWENWSICRHSGKTLSEKKAPNRCLKEENFSDTIRFSLLQWRLQRRVLFITMQMMSQPLIYNSSVYQKINLADFFAFHILTLNNNELYSCVPALMWGTPG